MHLLRLTACLFAGVLLGGCTPAPTAPAPVPADNEQAVAEPVLNPTLPIVEGKYRLTKEWSIALPGKFNRRMEDGSLVFWRLGITAWILVWNNDQQESSEQRCQAIRKDINPEAFDLEEHKEGDILRFSYRLNETRGAKVVHALYCFAFSDAGHVQMAVYFDAERDLETAKAMWKGLGE